MQDNTGSSRTARDALIIELLGDLGKVHDEVKKLPANVESALIDTINIIADSAEKLESSAETTKNETQAALAALSQKELETTKTKITEVVNNSIDIAIKSSLAKANSDIVQLENKIQSLSGNLRDKFTSWMLLVSLVLFCILTSAFGITMYWMYTDVQQNKYYSNYIYEKYTNQTNAINQLPKNVQQQIESEIKKIESE
ncbi:TPA: hypothetical protein I7721_19700 [Vibrio vulnificus]|nr:hypothetical protein [Vibrio vulnificus]